MSRTLISEEEVMQVAEAVRERFLREHSESDKFDPRDLQKVQRDLGYVAKFARQQSCNHDNTINQMTEALAWRHKFGINDIHYDDIEEYLWRSGMAYNHGLDKNGNNIVILNIRLHKKDSKKALALQRWIAFCFECHCRAYPTGRMCMIFDMNGCGLSQMDMDLMRFVVNSFKIYFPDLLAVLLVYNMPWILQAAWKIVQSWLSERAAAKVKFVNSETIQEYVSSEQLLPQFGGTDTWQFDYEREKEVMLSLIQEVLERERREEGGVGLTQSSEVHSSDMEQSQGGESVGKPGEEEEEKVTPQSEVRSGEESRKVRFSSNLPATRQSRYGPDNEEEEEEERHKLTSPDSQQLLRGSASSHGFRRRQVHKLISLQTEAKGERSSAMVESNHTPTSGDQRTPNTVIPFRHIQLHPLHELVFSGPRDKELMCVLSLTNTSSNEAVFKIKTTAPRRYKVRPNLSLIQPKAVAKVQILLLPETASATISDDKFLVQLFSFSATDSIPTQDQLLSFWKGLSDSDIMEHRLRCHWEKRESVASPKTLPSLQPGPLLSPPTAPTLPDKMHVHPQSELRILGDKLDRLVGMNQELSGKVQTLRNWIILLLLILVLLVLKALL